MSSGLMFSGSKAFMLLIPRSCNPESALIAASEGRPPGLSSLFEASGRVSRGDGLSMESHAASINAENARDVRAMIFFMFLSDL